MKRKYLAWTLMALMMAVLPLHAQDDDDDTVKIVYQCDFPDPKRVHLMLNTLNNAVKYYDKNMIPYEIDVVALGPCLQYFMKDFKQTGFAAKPYLEHGGPAGNGTRGRFKNIAMTAGDNMTFYACGNTMKKKNVKKEQLEDFVQVTPGGILKIVDDQRQGFAYIKIK